MGKLDLYVGRKNFSVSYDPSTLGAQKSTIIANAKRDVESQLTAKEKTTVDWSHFESNLGKLLDAGKEGTVSARALLRSGSGDPREVVIGVRTTGTESELRESRIKAKGLSYDDTVAASTGHVSRAQLDATGEVVSPETDWPHLKLTADQVKRTSTFASVFPPALGEDGAARARADQLWTANPKLEDYNTKIAQEAVGNPALARYQANPKNVEHEGCVEVVFGPLDVTNKTELDRRVKVSSMLEKELRDPQNKTLKAALDKFSAALLRLPDAEMHKYALNTVVDTSLTKKTEIDYSKPGATTGVIRANQTNVEVPLRRIGDVADTTLPALMPKDDKALFLKARAEANAYVDRVLVPLAKAEHGTVFDGSVAPKLEKLRAVMTLAVFSVAKGQDDSKAAFPLLPKTGFGDLIRGSLNHRDQAVLDQAVTADPDAFRASMLDMSAAARSAGGKSAFIAGTENWRAHRYIDLFDRGANTDRYGAESTGYGKSVDYDQGGISGTRTGKPIPTTFDRTRRSGIFSQVPKVVVEIRAEALATNTGLSGAIDRPNGGLPKSVHDPLKAVAEPTAAKPEKQLSV